MLFPELQHLLHFVGVQLHPLAAKLHQWRFGIDELLPLLLAHRFAANGQFVLILHQGVEGKVAFGFVVSPEGFALGLQPYLGPLLSLRRPPSRNNNLVARFLQYPSRLLQKFKGRVQIDKNAHGLVGFQPPPEAGIDARGVAQVQQQVLLEALAKLFLQFLLLAGAQSPEVPQGNAQGGIVFGGHQEENLPRLFFSERFLQLKIKVEGGVGMGATDAIAPGLPLLILLQLLRRLPGPLQIGLQTRLQQRTIDFFQEALSRRRRRDNSLQQAFREMAQQPLAIVKPERLRRLSKASGTG